MLQIFLDEYVTIIWVRIPMVTSPALLRIEIALNIRLENKEDLSTDTHIFVLS